MIRNETVWILNTLILLALLLVSCTPAVSEKEEKLVTGEEKVTDVVKEERAKGAEELKSRDVEEERGEEPQPQEPQPIPEEPQLQEPQPVPEEPQPQEPQEPQPVPEEVQVPVHKNQELALFALELINRDRVANGLNPVVLGSNIASQNHAEENLTNGYSSHWGMDGSKPYMRYTLAGGVNYVSENVLGTGTSGDPSDIRDPKEMLEQAQERFMDSPSHRATILNKWHKKVSLGIAYDDKNLHLVQHFEGDYIEFSEVPSISGSISGTILSMIGTVTIGNIEQVALHYDPLPQPLNPEQLNAPPYDSSYTLGEIIGYILPPPPPGSQYANLSPIEVIATTWDTKADGSFAIAADISQIFGEGNGVYTVVVLVGIGGEFVPISNYSIFVQ